MSIIVVVFDFDLCIVNEFNIFFFEDFGFVMWMLKIGLIGFWIEFVSWIKEGFFIVDVGINFGFFIVLVFFCILYFGFVVMSYLKL